MGQPDKRLTLLKYLATCYRGFGHLCPSSKPSWEHQRKVVFPGHLKTGWCIFSAGVTNCPEQINLLLGLGRESAQGPLPRPYRCWRSCTAIFHTSITSPLVGTTQQRPVLSALQARTGRQHRTRSSSRPSAVFRCSLAATAGLKFATTME